MLLSTLMLSVFAAPVFAQSRDEQAVSGAVEALRKALVDPDKATLDALVLDELTYGHSNGNLQDKAAFEEALLNKSSDFVTIDLTNQTVKVVGNTAWVRHTLTATTNDGGKPGNAHLSVLLIWVKQKGQWRLLARQAVKVQA
ncbi:MAG TPA: nuclear transport factor 2 family protein [Puia sp.]|uniref:nuclear transport factor 2 family protein n=1 Tax=Puia sp. TaxID=2045100 RepID=UPI002D1BE987|nr:nuclear transport factor 2 family protein [Puia sp.]HVU98220.1 nuclear transport factor 2 family protein [Puia sp.]